MALWPNCPQYTYSVPTSVSEPRILYLCHKVVALSSDSDEFEPAIRELKTAIHQLLEEARIKVAGMTLIVAVRNELQAAD